MGYFFVFTLDKSKKLFYTLFESKKRRRIMAQSFGSYIKEKRTSAHPKITLKSMSEQLGINLTLLSDIENDRKKPFPKEKIDLFCEIMNLDEEEKAEMYDLSAKYSDTASEDIVPTLMNENDSGRYARIALRMTKDGKISDEQWKQFVDSVEDKD